MGNAQSSPEDRKIAKPKTNVNARSSKSLSPASLPDDPNTGSTTLDQSSQGSPSFIASPTGDAFVDDHAFRHQPSSNTLTTTDESSQVHRQPTMDSLAASVVRTFSRRNSKSTNTISARSSAGQLQNGSQLSMASDRPIDLHSAIAILQELRKTASPEDMAALRKCNDIHAFVFTC